MGLFRLFLSLLILLVHDKFFKKEFVQGNDFVLIAGFFALTFIFVESGFIVGKQLASGKYTDYKPFWIRRLCRVMLPGLFFLALSSMIMTSPYHAPSIDIGKFVSSMSWVDQSIYYILNISLQQQIFWFFSIVDNRLVYDPLNQLGVPAFKILANPHYWSFGGDILFMIAIPYLFIKNKKTMIWAIFIILGFVQFLLNLNFGFVGGNERTSFFFQNYSQVIFAISFGFMFGSGQLKALCNYINLELNMKFFTAKSKTIQLIAGLMLAFLIFIILYVTYRNQLNYFSIYILLLVMSVICCEIFWGIFNGLKWDLELRDLGTHLYTSQFLVFYLVYIYLKIEPSWYSMLLSIFGVFSAGMFGVFVFEVVNSALINKLNKVLLKN